MSRTAATWPEAARALARRTTRRARGAALLQPAGWATLAAASVLLVTAAFSRPSPAAAIAVLGTGLASGLALGVVRARRVAPVAAADAAWALDRLAEAGERGLVAATVGGPAGSEAAGAAEGAGPPAVRLRPPEGLALLAGAALLGTLALLVALAPSGEGSGDRAPRTAAPPESAAGGREESRSVDDLEKEAEAAEAVREALGLSEPSSSDPAAVAERMQDAERRKEAIESARGTPLEDVLADPAATGDDLAQALAAGRRGAEQARRERRAQASARAAGGALPVPPARRGLIERYFASETPK